MASLDEELQEKSDKDFQDIDQQPEVDQEEIDEEQRRQEALENYRQQQIRQQQASQQDNPANKIQTAQKWYKRYKRSLLVVGLLTSTTGLWILLILGIIGGFMGACNSSTIFRGLSAGACEPFIINDTVAPPQAPTASNNSPQPYGKLTDAEARAQLTAAGITVNHPKPQTSLDGVNQGTITEIISLARGCDTWARSTAQAPQTATPNNACNVIVTGGTEGVHAEGTCSHQNGYKLDVGLNGTLNNYIMNSGFASEGRIRSDKARQFFAGSSIYALESNHWDILVGCS